MDTPQEQALLDYLQKHFDRLIYIERTTPTGPSLQILVRMMAGVLAAEMGARDLTERDLTRVVDPWCRLLKTWTREAYTFMIDKDRRAHGGAPYN
jgi:hypothetical protein